ncbi:TonB-dependent receptor [Caulobacter sp. 17J80-11]|uniref:TonB-dependent receptor n=1 Tax=Caulobacter sp. 17J80-11 TaxID=2763502 RepID=UPI001653B8CA|nr:TonB-dependent receptor [Caulobacter sp. 17J80-11]MBC6983401.1 TonB-dependent receptor [Caulobacter sp. 17J80-11]
MTASFKRNRARLMGGAATSLVLLLAGTGIAQAQDASDASNVDEVVVTGIRAGIESSIAVKKKESSIVEVVSAEDIGKLPDVSIAESIGRLPGLALQRLDGRGQVLSIRGLAPDFSTALLNGREQVTTGNNRGVEFDQYPSELLSSVVIYKTPDAALLGQGLAGTADMRTVRPLEYGKRAIAAGYRYEWNDIGALAAGSTDKGQRYSVSYIDQYFDGKLGLALGYSHINTPYQSERWNAWGYPTVDLGDNRYGQGPSNARTPLPGYSEEAGKLVLGGAKPYVMSGELERDSVMGTLEIKPDARATHTIDVFYSEFSDVQNLKGIEFPLYWSGATLQPTTTVDNGMITSGTFSGVGAVVRNDMNTRDATLASVGWNTTAQMGDHWTAVVDLSLSKVERTDMVLESYSGTGRPGVGATDTLGFQMMGDGRAMFSSSIDYADPSLIKLTMPQGWGSNAALPGGQDGYLNMPSTEDKLWAARVSAKRELENDWFDSVEFGLNLTDRSKTLDNEEWFLKVAGHPASVPIPASAITGTTSLDFIGIDGMVSYDPMALINSGVYSRVANPNADVAVKSWRVDEKVSVAFVKADIDAMVGSIPMTGNIGLQMVNTDQSSDALGAIGSPGPGGSIYTRPLSGGDEYTNFLPSLNLTFALPNEQLLRFGAARTMARARMDQMRASVQFNFDQGKATSTNLANSPWSANGGNPELKPWLADSIDVSYEKYFGRKAYVSAAAYYKDLKTYVYDRSELYDFSGVAYSGPTAPTLHQGYLTTPQNGEGGKIYGLELTASVPFGMFAEILDGFGVSGSASFTESSIKPNPGDPATPIPGLSDTVINTTIYYEKNGFEARVSDRYRSKFLGEVSGFGNGRTQRFVDAESVIDAQIGYRFGEGPMEGLSVLFQANNLTDEPFTTYQNSDSRQVTDFQRYGRTYMLGVNYRF